MVFLGLIVVGSLPQGKEVDNPLYKEWSGTKVNSWVTFEQPWGKDGFRQETYKLVEITKEKAVLACTIIENGVKFPVFEKVIRSRLQEKEGTLYAVACKPEGGELEFQGPGGKMKSIWRKSAEGDEEIDVAGTKMKCHWIQMDYQEESAIEALNDTHSTKTWYSARIPGGVAQLEMSRLIRGTPPELLVVNRVVKGWKME